MSNVSRRTTPVTGSELQRQFLVNLGGILLDNEIHTTLDQSRLFMGGDNLLSGGKWLGLVDNESDMLALNAVGPKGCFPMDMCYRTDVNRVYLCVTGRGQYDIDWISWGGEDPVDSDSSHTFFVTAAEVSYESPSSGGLTATNVQDAIDELKALIDAGGGGGSTLPANALGFLHNDGTGVLTWAAVSATPGGSNTQIQFNDGGAFGGDSDFTWDKTANLLTNSGDYTSGGALPGSTSLYIERSGFAIAKLKSTGQEARIRLERADTNKSVWLEFMRGDATNEWLLGIPNAGVIAGGNTFSIDYYDGTTEHAWLRLSTAGALVLPAYGVGFLKTDASGNVTASAGGTGDFVGPASATDNAVVRFDGTTGKLGQNSLVTIEDSGFVSIPAIATGSLRAGNLVFDTFNADNESIKFNQIYDGSNTKYIQSSQSGAISFSSGSFYFNTYASGSAGTNITGGKNPLTLFNTGFVGINNQTPSADLTVGNSGNAGTTSLIQSSSYVQLQMMRGTTNKFSLGVASGTGDFFTGTVADDVAFRNEGSKGFLFSTDNGSNVAFSILAANAGVKIQSPLAIADSLVNALLYVKNSYGSSGSGHASMTLDAGQTSATAAFNFAMASTGYWDVGCQGNTDFVIHNYQANRRAFTVFQSGSYAGMTQVLKGGTAITSWDASAVAVFQNNAAASDNANFHIIGGASPGVTGLWLGNSGNIYGGGLNYLNATNQLDFYSNSALALSISSAGAAVFASSVKAGGPVTAKEYTVSGLPSASTYAYSFAFVTDAVATAITGLGLAPVGGGSNKVPVYSDGTGWFIL